MFFTFTGESRLGLLLALDEVSACFLVAGALLSTESLLESELSEDDEFAEGLFEDSTSDAVFGSFFLTIAFGVVAWMGGAAVMGLGKVSFDFVRFFTMCSSTW